MNKFLLHSFLVIALIVPYIASAQNALQRAGHGITYRVEAQATVSDSHTPLWLAANRYGLSSVNDANGYVRASINRQAESDSAALWRIGYGADFAAAANFTSKLIVQQLYADVDYRAVRLTIGAKQQTMAFKHQELSSGSQTLGINARPVPQVMISIPHYINISGRKRWLALRAHISYGALTDGRFQESYTEGRHRYARKVLYHSKAGYLLLGNKSKFPLTFETGLEMAATFGGTAYNIPNGGDGTVKMGHSLKDFAKVFFGVGGDPTDGSQYANATGNTVGSWLFRLNYEGDDWSAKFYYDHFFEDHSQLFAQYGWRDGLVGIEVKLPHNNVANTLVYEYLNSTYQSGPIYHDHTPEIPDQISGCDNYYNHGIYAGWQHWGQAIGNPLFVSPLYNDNGDLAFTSNRIRAHHIGINGDPLPSVHYRLLYSYQRSVGTYAVPFTPARTSHSFLAEAHYSPKRIGLHQLSGWSFGAALGFDHGTLLDDSFGIRLTIAKSGLLTH